jgi:hypothetical protein
MARFENSAHPALAEELNGFPHTRNNHEGKRVHLNPALGALPIVGGSWGTTVNDVMMGPESVAAGIIAA